MPEGTLAEAVAEAKKQAPERKFAETVELAINLKDVDLSDPKNRVNEEIALPKGRGKQIKIAVFGAEELKSKVKGSVDYIFGPEDLSTFAEDKKAFKKIADETDFFIAESTLMTTIGKSLGQVLGPRGKIPRPIAPGQDPTNMIAALRRTVRVRSKDKRTFHVPIGTKSMSDSDLAENANAVLKRVISKFEKGTSNIDGVFVKTTMGKAVRMNAGDVK
ncbi:MAG: 50S ribosomal protein L1 [Candidatus Thermoplasmatota archaeon]|nr:50S ribosomal protein L1 [Candidatus Thermoplasmatota archaeon]MCL5785799.1 50S ribosomal protein L1 [Candidatus Thermoplasmatota archaeon]